jgi:hypothetical protein
MLISRRIRLVGHAARAGETMNAYRSLAGNLLQSGNFEGRLGDKIKTDVGSIFCEQKTVRQKF